MNKFPIRCITCGKVIGHLYREYVYMLNKGIDRGNILDSLDVKRYCCRRHFLGFEGVEDRSILINEYVDEEVR
ncbi:MAG: RpoN/RPB10 RNA polymerase subunit family protein [Candidatus Micrarchaeota archaeon]|nr:RpoN/RPB10 RNA polymerase subunit family protein [Candidatus Micrarchaeota archaeon]MCX8154285.1 RpoN/RPB10 RNA polymerase subunit family protein [Candidatus Micrarchaeota archaeon]